MGRTIVITGASRGLGLEFTRQYLTTGARVFALARDPDGSAPLAQLAQEHEHLTAVPCDVSDAAAVERAVQAIEQRADRIDILVQNAGTKGASGDRFGSLDYEDMADVFAVNTIAPLRITERCMKLLRQAAGSRVAFLTSRMGSIGDNDGGGWWSYRISKAALNMACQNLCLDLHGSGIAAMVLHPGWVRTDMGGPGAPLDAAESVRGMRAVIEEMEPTSRAPFRDYAGEHIEW